MQRHREAGRLDHRLQVIERLRVLGRRTGNARLVHKANELERHARVVYEKRSQQIDRLAERAEASGVPSPRVSPAASPAKLPEASPSPAPAGSPATAPETGDRPPSP